MDSRLGLHLQPSSPVHLASTPLRPAFLLAAIAAPLAAQQPPTPRPDSTRVFVVESVTVTRTAEPVARVPVAVGTLDQRAVRHGQATLGLDEALTNLPGVFVANRYNYSVDQRLSIRGFGSRANFGSRGVKILLDGVPQTLPDGQSQLTNVDLASIGRVEVLTGASSALYGNAAGGVISLTSLPTAPTPRGATLRYEGGSYGLSKGMLRLSGRGGAVMGAVTLSRTALNGFRRQSAYESRTASAALDWTAGPATLVSIRATSTDQPRADNPGALNAAELAADPDSAPVNNIVRDASKDVSQRQLSATVRHFGADGAEWSATAFLFGRDLDNPLATNNWNLIDRLAGGMRLQGSRPLGASGAAPRLTVGLDAQTLRDDRTNLTPVPAVGPVTDTTVRQRETVTEIGPFAGLTWSATPRLLLTGGARYDAVRFEVADHLLGDGDASGTRTMASLSGGVGASYEVSGAFVPYANVNTGFETPTTTELAVQESGGQGFNDSLGPQRALSFEVGARGRVRGGLSYSLALFTVGIRDALVPYAESGGRSFFRNAGHTRNKGYELGLAWSVSGAVTLQAAWTHADYRYTDYVSITNAGADTTDFGGRRLPGVPTDYVRLGLRTTLPRGLWLDVDHTLSSELYADDANTLRVDGWGTGVTNLRAGWDGSLGAVRLSPFGAVNNAWDRSYVGSVTVNGFGGRVYEPSPRRNYYVGVEVGWARR